MLEANGVIDEYRNMQRRWLDIIYIVATVSVMVGCKLDQSSLICYRDVYGTRKLATEVVHHSRVVF